LLCGWNRDKPAFLSLYLGELEQCAPVPIDRRGMEAVFTHCEILDVLWIFGWSVEPCGTESHVARLLDAIEQFWQRAQRGTR
jgi:hypothetical protein